MKKGKTMKHIKVSRLRKTLFGQSFLLMILLCSDTFAERKMISFDEEQRIPVKISNKSLNRITLLGDRIKDVYGVPEQVAVDKDVQTGQLFLKVPEGFHENLDITVITETELAQDLKLEPVEKDPTTLVIQMPGSEHSSKHSALKKNYHKASYRSSGHVFQEADNMAPSVLLSNTPYQDTLIQLMKMLFLGSFESESCSSGTRVATSGLSINFSHGFSRDGFVGEIFEVCSSSDEPQNIQERDFYKVGDLALALDKKTLQKGQKANLYVIRKD